MKELGNIFNTARKQSGISLKEVSKDIDIPVLSLKQIESGTIGAFQDLYDLKIYLQKYSIYLGLDKDEVLNLFNEYMFEVTSKIPLDEIMKKHAADDEFNINLSSPYTEEKIVESKKELFIIILFVSLFILIVFYISYTYLV